MNDCTHLYQSRLCWLTAHWYDRKLWLLPCSHPTGCRECVKYKPIKPKKITTMTNEQLELANKLKWEIIDCERTSGMLNKMTVCINDSFQERHGIEEEIELTPEEKEALESLRRAYLTVLHTANNRKLSKLRTQFEAV